MPEHSSKLLLPYMLMVPSSTELKKMASSYEQEHAEIYDRLNQHLHALVKVKNTANNPYLLVEAQKLNDYVKTILLEHFSKEEAEFFIHCQPDSITRLLEDHREIENKYKALTGRLLELELLSDEELEQLDLQDLLFTAYNLIGTISHHAQREDRFFAEF